jgi:gliding motility-associated-like protein
MCLTLTNPIHLVGINMTYLFRLVGIIIFFTGSIDAFSQQIPRAGFPYCQPFLGNQDVNSIPFTVADGEGTFNSNPFIPYQTGQGLRLVESGVNLRGWIFVDLPFSPTYGIKTSFEYFIHNQGTSSGLGDGFSFFLFDGKIDKTTFEIGGLGGSLGYAPHGNNVSGAYTSGGLKGGYMGIGFDVLGNYGNYQEKKFGGYHDPNQFNFTSSAAFRRAYPDAITIRSPQDPLDILRNNGGPTANTNNPPFKSYQFVTGKILYYDPSYIYPLAVDYMNFRVNTAGSGLIYSTPSEKDEYMLDDSEMFKLTEGLAPSNFSCTTRPKGYRKVFIDLKPNVGNPLVPYTITIDLLIDNEPTTRRIVDNQPYAYPIPSGTEFLKLGFSASTGTDFYSAIDIRNVAALVSSVDDQKKPTPPELFKEICVEDNSAVELPFCVTLADQNTFIQCIQLFDSFSPADNNFQDDFYQCEQPGFCDQRCSEAKKELEIIDGSGGLIGILKADLSDQVEVGKYNQANITFQRNPSSTWVGTIKRYYKIVDNFGLESDAIPITITINPKPKIIFKGVPENPTCSGQNDGSLTGIKIGDLVPDPGKYTIEFYDENGTTINAVLVSEQVNSNGLITATFDLKNLNLGKIFVKATNPSSTALGPICGNNNNQVSDPCVLVDELVYDFNQETGTPVIIVNPVAKICENNPVSFTPDVNQVYKNNVSSPPVFLWYTDKNRVNKINPSLNSIIVNGTTIATGDIVISSSGVLSFQSLPAGQFEFFVEVDDTNFPTGGNFCINSGELKKVELSVIPAITIKATSTPDWCLGNLGTITIETEGGSGNRTVKLFRNGSSTPIDSKVGTGNTFTFSGLTTGDYQVEISTQNPSCIQISPTIKVDGPTVPLTLTDGPPVNAFCNGPNGSLQFNLTGGNPAYTITLNGNPLSGATVTGSTYTVNNLPAGDYKVKVTDSKGCIKERTLVIAGDPLSQYGTVPDEICEGETAQVSPRIITQSSSTPTYKWFFRDGAGAYVQINNGNTVNGVSFAIDASNNLSVTGLAPQAAAYTYYLEVTGPKVCAQGYIPAQILVNPKPIISAPTITQVTCKGLLDGSIRAQLGAGNLADFEFNLVGNNGFNSGYLKNSGVFTGLAAGTYELFVRSGKGCISTLPSLVVTEPPALVINQVAKVDATCDEDNGSFQFTVSGGTPLAAGGYTLEINGAPIASLGTSLTTNSPTDFTVSKRAPGNYIIKATDKNNCVTTLTITIADTPIPVFDVQDDLICEGETAVFTPQIISNTIGAVPVFTWSYEDPAKAGTLIEIKDGDVVSGVTYDVTNGVLSVTGLAFDADPYLYFLTVSGSKVCPGTPIQAEVKVKKVPVAVLEETPVSCFGGNNGQIKLISVNTSGPNTFTLVQTGATNTTGNFAGLVAGNYTVRVQENGSPCFKEFPIAVTQPDLLQLVDLDPQDPTCGQINGSVKFKITGGVKDYQIRINAKPLSDYTSSLTAGVYEVKNLAPGSYSVEVKDANACLLNLPNLFSLTNDDGFTINLAPMEDESCVGQESVLTPVFNVAVPVVPVLKWYKDAALTQPITSSPSPAADGVTYQINSTSGALSLKGLQAGTFTYYLEISGPGICTVVKTGKVIVYPPISATATIENITCFGDTNGSISLVPSGGNGNFEVSINNSPFTSTLNYTNLAPGSYTIAIRNSVGCTFSQVLTVKSPPGPIAINSPSIERSSCDLNNGAIKNLVISGGWGGYTVEWRKGSATGPIIAGTLTEALNLAPSKYFLKVTDLEGCAATFEFEIVESSDPVYAIVPPINSCSGTPVRIRPVHIAPNPSLPPAAPTEVRWYAGPNQTGLIQNGADPTLPGVTYTIDDSDWLNPELKIDGLPAGTYDFYFYVVCTGKETKVDVSVFDVPTVAVDTDPVTCFGDTNGKIRLVSGVLPFHTFQLNGGGVLTQTGLEALNLPAGNYSLAVLTPAGCAQTISITLEGPTGPLAVSPLTRIDPGCGASNGKLLFSVSGGYLPYTINVIKDGVSQGTQTLNQTNFQLDGYRPGVYQVRISDREGCLVQTNTVTMVDGPTQIVIPDEAICVGEVASLLPTLDPPAPGAAFQWFFDAAKTQPITSSPTPASDGRIYQINSTTGELQVSNLPESASSYTYYVTASGSGVCPGFTGSAKVKVFGLATATVQVSNEVCFGTGGTITLTTSGGSGNYSYSLNGGAFGNSNVFQVPTGTYSIVIRTSEGCSTTVAGIAVTGPAAALSVSGFQQTNPSCELDDGSIQFSISGGYAPYQISYTRNGVNAGNTTLPAAGTVNIGSLNKGTYAFTVLDAQGCSLVAPTPLNLVEIPTVITVQDDTICAGEGAVLSPSLPASISNPTYTWSFDPAGNNRINSGTVNGVTYTLNSNGTMNVDGLSAAGSPYTYYIMASGPRICGLSPKPVRVFVNEIPTLRVSNPSVVCNPQGRVELTRFIEGFNPAIFDYNVLSPSGSAMQIGDLNSVAISGDYRVSSSLKGKGCWNQSQRIRVIIADEELIANFQYEVDLGNGSILTNSEIQILEDVQFIDNSLGKAIIWNWDFGDGTTSGAQNPIHQYKKKGIYTISLQAIDEFGCISVYERVVRVFDDYIVMVPNAFTPEGAKNQFFKPYFRGIGSMEFYIFNTWGELIYHAKSLEDKGWDGTHLGKPAPNGNYVYKGRFVSRAGETFERSGVFILIR